MAVSGTEAMIADSLIWQAGQVAASLGLQIAFPNVPLSQPVGTPYLALTVMPNTAVLQTMEFGGDVDHQGLLQISVFWPSGQGMVKPMSTAAAIVKAFAPGTRIDRNLVSVRVNEQPRIAPALQESDWCQVPVTVRWRAFYPAGV